MVDLVEVKNVPVHVAPPGKSIPTNWTRVRLALSHDRYLDRLLNSRLRFHQMGHGNMSVHVCLPVEDLVTIRTDVFGEGSSDTDSWGKLTGTTVLGHTINVYRGCFVDLLSKYSLSSGTLSK